MKKLLFVGIMCLVLASTRAGLASPFLVCDPHASATKFQLEINGEVVDADTSGAAGALTIKHDLAGIAEGAYVFRARAGNLWEWSIWTIPLNAAKALPNVPSGFGIVE